MNIYLKANSLIVALALSLTYSVSAYADSRIVAALRCNRMGEAHERDVKLAPHPDPVWASQGYKILAGDSFMGAFIGRFSDATDTYLNMIVRPQASQVGVYWFSKTHNSNNGSFTFTAVDSALGSPALINIPANSFGYPRLQMYGSVEDGVPGSIGCQIGFRTVNP